MRATTGFLLALAIGAATGLGLSWWTLAGGPSFGALTVGPWTAWPRLGVQDADRYARASVARSGELPLGPGEGLGFVARTDSAGKRLDGRCRYRIAPIAPPARWWTLSLYDETENLVANPAERYGFASTQVVRDSDGSATVMVAPEASAGNWLPSPPAGFHLVLRLYDSPVSTGLGTEDTVALPSITREACP